MKLKKDEHENMIVLSVRGQIDPKHLKMLLIGCQSMTKTESQHLVFNFSNATFSDAVGQALAALKLQMSKSKFNGKIAWISKNKVISDFPSLDLFFSRLAGSRYRQIKDKTMLDDQIDILLNKKIEIEARIQSILGEDESAHTKAIIENQTLKATLEILQAHFKSLQARHSALKAIPTENEEHDSTLKDLKTMVLNALKKDQTVNEDFHL